MQIANVMNVKCRLIALYELPVNLRPAIEWCRTHSPIDGIWCTFSALPRTIAMQHQILSHLMRTVAVIEPVNLSTRQPTCHLSTLQFCGKTYNHKGLQRNFL